MVQPHKRYDFVTLSPTELGGVYRSMKVVAILTASQAMTYRDIYTLHEKMKRYLTQEYNVEDLTYILFEGVNKQTVLIPWEYLDSNSVVEVEQLKLVIEIPNANTTDISMVADKLTELGFKNCKITHTRM
jgi:hypothetical protein|nr:MAG TPA: hypothetical protein [Caudoviricetes sp.]